MHIHIGYHTLCPSLLLSLFNAVFQFVFQLKLTGNSNACSCKLNSPLTLMVKLKNIYIVAYTINYEYNVPAIIFAIYCIIILT